MTSKILAVVILIASLGFIVSQNSAIREQRQQIQDLTVKLNSASNAAPSLELQEKCAVQSRTEFKTEGWDKEQGTSYLNHYDPTLKKCFLEIEQTSVEKFARTAKGHPVPFTSLMVSDAFEGRSYASYSWRNPEGKKYWDVAPAVCTVTFPASGEQQTCQSKEEFDALVAQAFGIREE
jgi:hypothetical protein